ncbi:hypothetical protein L6164_024115 [Bauhinia variegata]|uniref:Uncharacterized protein n=1 Tax=Bauhinia variegata TaxID=167791 RepID=A0ACB9LWT1_BAUVA|nr:hypothetical protein L6164_024115 [Bauhinia variegata]
MALWILSPLRAETPSQSDEGSGKSEGQVDGKVIEVKLSNGDPKISDAQWRRIAYGSVSPFALLQSRRSSISGLSKSSMSPSPYHLDWCEYVTESSKGICSLLCEPKLPPNAIIEGSKQFSRKVRSLCH